VFNKHAAVINSLHYIPMGFNKFPDFFSLLVVGSCLIEVIFLCQLKELKKKSSKK
jgi:hypothetical protein